MAHSPRDPAIIAPRRATFARWLGGAATLLSAWTLAAPQKAVSQPVARLLI